MSLTHHFTDIYVTECITCTGLALITVARGSITVRYLDQPLAYV